MSKLTRSQLIKYLSENPDEEVNLSDLEKFAFMQNTDAGDLYPYNTKSVVTDAEIGDLAPLDMFDNKPISHKKFSNNDSSIFNSCEEYMKLLKSRPDLVCRMRIKEICNLLEGKSSQSVINACFDFEHAIDLLEGDNTVVKDYVAKVLNKKDLINLYKKEKYDKAKEHRDEMQIKHSFILKEIKPPNFCGIKKKKNLIAKLGDISDEDYLEDYFSRFKDWVEDISVSYLGVSSKANFKVKLFSIVVAGRYLVNDNSAITKSKYLVTVVKILFRDCARTNNSITIGGLRTGRYKDILLDLEINLKQHCPELCIKNLCGDSVNLAELLRDLKALPDLLENLFIRLVQNADKNKLPNIKREEIEKLICQDQEGHIYLDDKVRLNVIVNLISFLVHF